MSDLHSKEGFNDDLRLANEKLNALAEAGKTNEFERLAMELKKDFINNAPAEMKFDLYRMQKDIDKELSQCKTSADRLAVISHRLQVLQDYLKDVLNGTAPVCAKFPGIVFVRK